MCIRDSASIKLLIWFSLCMIFVAKVKDENEKSSRIRIKAICYAIYLLGIYYIVMLVRGVYNGDVDKRQALQPPSIASFTIFSGSK